MVIFLDKKNLAQIELKDAKEVFTYVKLRVCRSNTKYSMAVEKEQNIFQIAGTLQPKCPTQRGIQ